MCGRALRSVLPCKQEKLKIKARTDDEVILNKDRRVNRIKPNIMSNIQVKKSACWIVKLGINCCNEKM